MNEPPKTGSDKTVRDVVPPSDDWLRLDSSTRRVTPAKPSDSDTRQGERSSHSACVDADRPLPGRVGPYEIICELGRGGMGVVYHARDPRLKRDVALKMVLAGPFAAVDQLKRFHAEAEAVARLRHPHIVQIYEIGEYDGKPFVALEYLDGGTLRDHCAGRPQPPLAAATLVHALAGAMAYAHGSGIIHRDLKPANILMASEGRRPPDDLQATGGSPSPSDLRSPLASVKITDFGLAKFELDAAQQRARTEGGQTRTGEVLGTPQYMAPEQAQGRPERIGPAADIYSLGAILYELMTGRPPFDGPTPMDTLLRLTVEDVLAPSRLVGSDPRVCPRDLETICLKCLQKEPAKRYSTAQDLADDLQRFLNGEPIRARPVGRIERTVKWVRRQPAVSALLALLALVIIGSLVITTMLWQRAERRGQLARERFLLARDAVDQMLTEVGQEYLKHVPHMTAVRQRLLEQARGFYHKFLAEQGDDPDVLAETGRAYRRVGDVYGMMGKSEEAEKAYRDAEVVQAQLVADSPTVNAHRRDLAHTRHCLGNLLRETARAGEAERQYAQAVDLQQRLSDDHPGASVYRLDLARTLHDLGCVLDDLGRPAEAEAAHRRGLEHFDRLSTDTPEAPEIRFGRARSLAQLARLARGAGRYDEAERDYQIVLGLLAKLAEDNPVVPEYRHRLATCQQNLGWLFAYTKRPDAANAICQQAIKTVEKLTTDFPAVPAYQDLLATLHNTCTFAFALAKRFPEAEAACRQSLALRRQLVAAHPTNPDFRRAEAECHHNLGGILMESNRPDDAEAALRLALAQRKKLVAEFPRVVLYLSQLATTYPLLTAVLQTQKRSGEIMPLLEEEIAAREQVVAAAPGDRAARRELAERCGTLAEFLEEAGRRGDAVQWRRQAAILLEKVYGEEKAGSPANPQLRSALGAAQNDLAYLLMDEQPREALRLLDQAVMHQRAALDAMPDNKTYVRYLANHFHGQAEAHLRLTDPSQAATATARFVSLHPNAADELVTAAELFGACHRLAVNAGQSKEADAYATQALAALRQAVDAGYQNAAALRTNPRLATLHDRADFRTLVAAVEANAKKGKPAGP